MSCVNSTIGIHSTRLCVPGGEVAVKLCQTTKTSMTPMEAEEEDSLGDSIYCDPMFVHEEGRGINKIVNSASL